MAQLAIKGHETRGKEVIEILEMLGGSNKYHFRGDEDEWFMLNGNIQRSDLLFDEKGFTLEEFLEKYPYKVGDKVKAWVNGYRGVFDIQDIAWDSIAKEVKYKIRGYWHSAENLQPYKEETIEETDTMNHTTEINLNHPCFKGCNEIEIIIPDGWEFKQRDNKMFGVRKQYPKTYVECAKILKCFSAVHIDGYRRELLEKLQELIVCRDAYWKIAGEQMGLDKPWEPENPTKHYIFTIETCGDVIKNAITSTWWNRILVFPTEEMRDAFYENFKDLIEECKEFL